MGKVVVEFFAHEKDVIQIVKKIQETVSFTRFGTLSIGNCGWANCPDCWWIRFRASVKERQRIVDWILLNSDIQLIIPELVY